MSQMRGIRLQLDNRNPHSNHEILEGRRVAGARKCEVTCMDCHASKTLVLRGTYGEMKRSPSRKRG